MKWSSIRLGDVANFVNGYPFKPSDWEENGLEIIRIQNLTRSGSDCNYYCGTLPDKYKVIRGDILISWSATLDIFVWSGEEAWLNQHIFKVVFDKIEIDKNYFIYSIKYVLDDMRRQVHGATMQHITKGKFDEIQIPLPPLPIQKRIADILDAADALRKKDQELLKKYDELAQAIFIDMFGDPVKNEKGWEVKKMGDAIKMKAGNFIQASEIHSEFSENLFPCFGGNGLRGFARSFTHDGKYVLIGRQGALCGNVKVAIGKFHATEHAIVCSPKIDYNVNWLYYLLSILNLNKYATGAAQPGLNVGNLEEIEIIFAPLKLQELFANNIRLLKSQKLKIEISLKHSNQLFNSIIQKSFSGELVS
jgi:type I restriction enzyme S subunit